MEGRGSGPFQEEGVEGGGVPLSILERPNRSRDQRPSAPRTVSEKGIPMPTPDVAAFMLRQLTDDTYLGRAPGLSY